MGLRFGLNKRYICYTDKTPQYAGFTLIEVVLAVAILSIGMLATGALVGGIIKGNKISRDITTATIIAQDKMETIRKIGYSGLSSSDSILTEDYGDLSYSVGAITADYPSFKRITSIQVDHPVAGIKMVTVAVYWKTGNNPITLNTYISE